MQQLIRYNEQLEDDELSFLKKKEQKERAQFYKIIRLLMVLCFILPFGSAWYKALKDEPNPFSSYLYFQEVLFLICFCSIPLYIGYRSNLGKLRADLLRKTKTIELTHITRKQYMPQNNTYYFYLNSPNRLSIEVSQADFYRLDLGDEVSIEYTSRARLYLGYF